MSETQQDETKEERHKFIVQVSFWQPNSGTLNVRAKDEAHARELLPKLLQHVKDLEIHDIVREDQLLSNPIEDIDMGTPPTAAVN